MIGKSFYVAAQQQSAGEGGASAGGTVAWDRSSGDGDIVVCVIDSGIDYTHPDLQVLP